MVWAKKYLSRGFIFAEEPTSSQGILPSHQACGKILRQNTLGTRFGGRNCKTAKINCKFVDTGITTLFLPLGTCDTLDTNSIPGGYTIGLGREYGEWHPPVLCGK